jgi:hypothetical protein
VTTEQEARLKPLLLIVVGFTVLFVSLLVMWFRHHAKVSAPAQPAPASKSLADSIPREEWEYQKTPDQNCKVMIGMGPCIQDVPVNKNLRAHWVEKKQKEGQEFKLACDGSGQFVGFIGTDEGSEWVIYMHRPDSVVDWEDRTFDSEARARAVAEEDAIKWKVCK